MVSVFPLALPVLAFPWQSSLLFEFDGMFFIKKKTSLRFKLPRGDEAERERCLPPPFACYQTMKQTG